MILEFENWQINRNANRLENDKEQVKLEPKAMAVLCYLAERCGETVSREELEQACWTDQVVGYDALSNTVIKIRKALNDNARNPSYIETVSKKGYRFIAQVLEVSQADATVSEKKPNKYDKNYSHIDSSKKSEQLDDKPVIAILPFRTNCELNEIQPVSKFTGEAFAEEVLVELSRQSRLVVISRNSSFFYRNKDDHSDISNGLNTDYFVEGSIVASKKTSEVFVSLVNASNLSVIWADKFRLPGLMPIANCKAICSSIVRAVTTALGIDKSPIINRGTLSDAAYSNFLKGRELDRLDTSENNRYAREHFLRAIAADPEFSLAHSYLSRSIAVSYINRWSGYSTEQLLEALDYAEHAIRLDCLSPHAHFAKSASLLWIRKHDEALLCASTSLQLDSNFAEAHAVEGMAHIYNSAPFKALAPLNRAMTIDPHFRDAYQHIQAQAYFHLRDYENSRELLLQRLVRKPESDTSHVLLASTYGHLGNAKEAIKHWKAALNINPGYSLEYKQSILPYKDSSMFDEISTGLSLVGIKHNVHLE